MSTRHFVASGLAALAAGACIPTGPASAVQSALSSAGEGAVVQLCPGATISVTTTSISFTAPNQEISTQGYPTDDTRATILIEVGATVGTAIYGWGQTGSKLLNIQVDGNRPNAGIISDNALVEMGQVSTATTVSNCVIKNTRTWSCLHVIGSGETANPCSNASITYNTVGPCGNEGTDANGNSLWADGISLDCTNSEVMYNSITGSTDGGIVLFGAPGTHVVGNSITSSATDEGFGAINMVDDEYNGNYAGVVVTNNTIRGQGTGFFNLGIGIGSWVWSFNEDTLYTGPATITNNNFIGNIGFSIVINGWTDGLTVTGNDISEIATPSSSFAGASQCAAQVQDSFNANQQLIVYMPDVTGPLDLQSNFVSVSNNASNWLCLSHPLPNSQSFAAGSLSINAQTSTIVNLNNFHVQIQGDGNLVGYDTAGGVWTAKWASGLQTSSCGSTGSSCEVIFGSNGDFVDNDGSGQLWHTNTAGQGSDVVFSNTSPYFVIQNSAGATVWSIADGVTEG